MQIDTEDYLPTADAAEALGLGRATIKVYCQRGLLEGVKVGSIWLIPKAEIRRYKRTKKSVGRPAKKSQT